MLDNERNEQEAYERGFDIEEMQSLKEQQMYASSELQEEKEALQNRIKKVRTRSLLWMISTIIVVAALAVVSVLWFRSRGKISPGSGEEPTGTVKDSSSYRLCSDIEKKIEEYNALGGPYTASLETMLGTEYVAFAYGGATDPEYTLLYRNEYPSSADAAAMECGSWMRASQTVSFRLPYTLADDWSLLTPEPTIMGGTKYVLFVEMQRDLPQNVVVLEPGLMNVSDSQNIYDAVRNWFTIGVAPGATAAEAHASGVLDGRDIVVLTTGSNSKYCFSASDEVLGQVSEKGGKALRYGDHFTWEITEEGIKISSLLYIKEGEYYGVIDCTMLPNQGTLRVTSATLGMYTSFNIEDMYFSGVSAPSIEYIENPVTLTYGTNEKLLLPEYKRVEKHAFNFDADHYYSDSNGFRYVLDDNGNVISRMGIDLSHHTNKKGEIDWDQVKAAGIDFVIVRIGFRGPGEGTLEPDEYAADNIKNALEHGMDVGVYFYSQAITEAEAVAEADYVLNFLKDYEITWPIVFDTEYYEREGARGNVTSREERTAVAKAFLDHVRDAGYTAMLYAGTRWSILNVNRDELAEYPFWFAYYGDTISYRYDFNIWQYTSTGSVPGITGNVDLDLWLKPWENVTPPRPTPTPEVTAAPDDPANTGDNANTSDNANTGDNTNPDDNAGTGDNTNAGDAANTANNDDV